MNIERHRLLRLCIRESVVFAFGFALTTAQCFASGGLTPVPPSDGGGAIPFEPTRQHLFYTKCSEPKPPSGVPYVASGESAGLAPYDDRTQLGQDRISQLEAQGGVLWKVMLVNKNGGVGPYSFYRKHESAKREVARILKELANPKSYWHWWMKVADAFVEAEMNCGNTGGSGGDLPWFAGLKKINPNASPELLRLTSDALVEPPLMWYQNYLQGLVPAFIAQQGGGLAGDALFRGATANFYPASGTPGGVIGEYAQLFTYNLGMLAQLRNLYQATVDNAITGINYSLNQLQEGIRFAEQLEATHIRYLMPTGKSFTAGDYRQLSTQQFLETVGPELFEPFQPGQYIFSPPDPEAEQANVRVAPTAGGFEVTATSASDPSRSIRVVLPDLDSWFDSVHSVPGGLAEDGIYDGESDLSVNFTASGNNWGVKNGTKIANSYSYFFPGFVRWVEGDSVTTDPVLSGIRNYWRANPIAIDPLTTGAWFFSFSEPDGMPALGLTDLIFFYRADGKHLVYFSGELPSRSNPQIERVGLVGLGQVNPANSQDDRVPLRITVSPDQTVTVPVGGALTLKGTILGEGPVTNVKWRANYIVVQSGGMSLTKTNMQPHHSGFYALTASNAHGLASSLPVLVQVKGGQKDGNANLLGLELAGIGELSPDFLPAVRAYSATAQSNTLTTAVTPTVEADAQIKVRINGGTFQSVASGSSSQPLTLQPGTNSVQVQVTAPDGKTQKTYSINVAAGGGSTPTPSPTPFPTPFVKLPQFIPAFAATNNVPFGSALTFANTTTDAGLAVIFERVSGPVVISNNTARITGVGPVVIRALAAGNANYFAAVPLTNRFTTVKADQSIAPFAPISSAPFGAVLAITNTRSSVGLPVRFGIISGPAKLDRSGTSLTVTGVGTVVLRASQPGNTNYNAAPLLTNTFAAIKGRQTISFSPKASVSFKKNATVALGARSSARLPVRYTSSDTNVLTISRGAGVMKSRGTVQITAKQAGNTNYNAAPEVVRTIEIR